MFEFYSKGSRKPFIEFKERVEHCILHVYMVTLASVKKKKNELWWIGG